jgi:predicted nucleic acid-binding protein
MPLFLDACALAKRYLPEGRSTQTVNRIIGRSRALGGLVVSTLVEPEVVSALARFVRDRPLPEQRREATRLHPRSVQTFRTEYRKSGFSAVPITDELLANATDIMRDAPQWSIGAADAVHLATALQVRSRIGSSQKLVFVTADQGLYEAAKASGLAVHNPNYQSPHGPGAALRRLTRPAVARDEGPGERVPPGPSARSRSSARCISSRPAARMPARGRARRGARRRRCGSRPGGGGPARAAAAWGARSGRSRR